jgi:nucleotide-binding universal stress UspA family protein
MSIQFEPRTARQQASATGPVIVAGYDGSPESRAAVANAEQRAGPQGTVVVVHVADAVSDWLGTPYYDRAVEAEHLAARTLLDEIEESANGEPAIEHAIVEGDPAEALMRVAQARDAREIVVGSRGRGRLRAVMGSVSHRLLERSDRPVVVIPPLDRRS